MALRLGNNGDLCLFSIALPGGVLEKLISSSDYLRPIIQSPFRMCD